FLLILQHPGRERHCITLLGQEHRRQLPLHATATDITPDDVDIAQSITAVAYERERRFQLFGQALLVRAAEVVYGLPSNGDRRLPVTVWLFGQADHQVLD